jgi:Ni2+-binding GTPase involved in maturation of urease and hydrogenase
VCDVCGRNGSEHSYRHREHELCTRPVQQTDNDARRIADCGVPVWQVNTGAICHLDAQMVFEAWRWLASPIGTTILIENVGNLICPAALFDLGEASQIVVVSVAESEDKPDKYPYMFQAADLVVLNKCDLLPYLPFDCDRFVQILQQVNPGGRCCAYRRRAAAASTLGTTGCVSAGHRLACRLIWSADQTMSGTYSGPMKLSNLVVSASKCSRTVPIGPWRCLAIRISAVP